MNFSELMARRGTPSYAAFLGRISAGKKSMRSKFDIRRSYRSVSCGALDQRPRRPGEKGLVPRTGVRGGGGLAVTPDVPSAHAEAKPQRGLWRNWILGDWVYCAGTTDREE